MESWNSGVMRPITPLLQYSISQSYSLDLPAALTFFQRSRAIAASRALAAALSFRRRLRPGLAAPAAALNLAHLFLAAARIRAIPAALIFFRFTAAVLSLSEVPNKRLSSWFRPSILSLRFAARLNCCADRFVIDVFISSNLNLTHRKSSRFTNLIYGFSNGRPDTVGQASSLSLT